MKTMVMTVILFAATLAASVAQAQAIPAAAPELRASPNRVAAGIALVALVVVPAGLAVVAATLEDGASRDVSTAWFVGFSVLQACVGLGEISGGVAERRSRRAAVGFAPTPGGAAVALTLRF